MANELPLLSFYKFVYFSETRPYRHVICEECKYPVQGGFDPKVNQVKCLMRIS